LPCCGRRAIHAGDGQPGSIGPDRLVARQRREAPGKTFEAWEEEATSIPAATQQALRTLEWVERGEDLCVCGPSGTGKSHFVEALGHLAIDKGKTVAWHTLESLEALLRGHRADGSVAKAIAKLIRADLVLVDDVGMVPGLRGGRRGALSPRRRRL
jgi:DNA replication protein DnaC